MRIAVTHNLPSGGAMRLARDFVRELSSRGHELVEYAPSTADITFAPLLPYVRHRHILPVRQHAFLRRRVPSLTPYIHAVQMLAAAERSRNAAMRIAREINSERFDLALVHDCRLIM